MKPSCIAVSQDGSRIAVGDPGAKAVFVFDKSGKVVTRIGGIGPRKKGPWNPLTIDQPCAVTIDKAGRIWVCEKTYTPKRITRYSADGQFEKEFLGPPHYGGGGYLDPNLKSFWYEACEYEIDFEKGTSRLKNLNDVQADPETPTPDGSSYSYTKVGRPIYANGHRYIVGDAGGQYCDGFVICIYDEGQNTWKPAAVMGRAQGSVFLTRADKPWRSYWLKQDLSSSSFIWCDLNGDGKYQIEEVQLFNNAEVMGGVKGTPFNAPYWGAFCGPDLTFWGSSARLAPSRFTDQGVPVFEKSRIQPFDYSKLAPVYMGNEVHNQVASTGFGGVSMVARDGCLALQGQPYLVKPDLTVKGGPVTEKPSDFLPKILGTTLDNPLSFVGSAESKSPVGEVAMINGDNGRWFLWSVEHGVLLGEIFTGKSGGFGAVTGIVRGMDVTDYKQDWETFFGDFIGAENGNYYVVAGRGHWGVSRVEGINGITLTKTPLRISAEDHAKNTALRPQIIALSSGTKKAEKREMKVAPLASRTKAFALDGNLGDWGDQAGFQKIGADGSFDAAWDPDALTLAWAGKGGTDNSSQDWRYLFKTGFCVDVSLRSGTTATGGEIACGDRRVVIGRHQGKWLAVLYDFVRPEGAGKESVSYTSPVTTTRVDRVVLLPDSEVKIAANESNGVWSAEARIAWSALGITPSDGMKIRADAGILNPDSAGLQVDRRTNWSDPDTGHVADLAVEAQIHPANFGTWTLQK